MPKFTFLLLLLLTGYATYVQQSNAPTDSVLYSYNLDKPAQFKGGDAKLNKFIRQNTNYPKEATKAKEGGLVIVSILIDEEGRASQPRIHGSKVENMMVTQRKDLQEEAVRIALLTSGLWEPGSLNGVIVPRRFLIPFRFTYGKSGKK